MEVEPQNLRMSLNVEFQGEEGSDYGGLSKEWFMVLFRQIRNPDYFLFKLISDQYSLQINPGSKIEPKHLTYFDFIGRITAMVSDDCNHLMQERWFSFSNVQYCNVSS